MSAQSSSNDRLHLGARASTVVRTGLGLAAIGLGGGAIIAATGGEHGWDHFFRSYIVAFVFAVSISLGALFFVIIQHATRAGWCISLRRIAEAYAANFAWLWVFFIPIVVSLWKSHNYHWVHPEGDPILEHKAAFLNVPFWLVRAVVYMGIWAFFGLFFFRNSVAQDRSGDIALTHRMQRLAPVAALLFALSLTFAAFDWMMSLEAHWFSTMFGVTFFAASCCGFFSVLILSVYWLQRRGLVDNQITLEHYQDMGKLLFAFGVVFWAYIYFSQFMLIWYANIPEETTWYLARTFAPWSSVTWMLLAGHFIAPFLLLVTKHTKRIPIVLASIAGWMLLMHFVDMYWQVMPKVPSAIHTATDLAVLSEQVTANAAIGVGGEGFDPALDVGYAPSLMDPALVLGMIGLLVAGAAYRLRSCSLVPVNDPRLDESLAFENM